MKLRAQFTIDIDARDYSEAAEHQSKVERLFAALQDEYSQASLTFRERRDRTATRMMPPARTGGIIHYTGRVHDYE